MAAQPDKHVHQLVDHLFRHEAGRMASVLTRLLGFQNIELAEDIVQDTFLKWLSAEKAHIQNTKAYLIKAVTNNALNHLTSLKKKKEEYLGVVVRWN